jgi:hypothetical protein
MLSTQNLPRADADRTFNWPAPPEFESGLRHFLLQTIPAFRGIASLGWRFSRHSHSIISRRLNYLFRRSFCALRYTDTVRHTAEKNRWSAIDPDRSRQQMRSLCPLPKSERVGSRQFTVKRDQKCSNALAIDDVVRIDATHRRVVHK